MSDWNAAQAVRAVWPRGAVPALTISRPAGIQIAAIVAFSAATLFLLNFASDSLYTAYYNPGSWKIYAPFAAALAAAAVFANTRYGDFAPLLKAILRASAVGIVVLLIAESPDYTLGDPAAARALEYVRSARPFAIAAAVVGMFRPAFVIPAVIYLASTRHLIEPISGLQMSWLDIRYMLDMALYLAVFGIAVVKVGPRIHPWLASTDRQMEIVGVGMGLHLANYFWSGVAKLAAGPTPWYWIFENQTNTQIPQTIESGILPLGHIPWLSQLAYDAVGFFNAPLNLAIVLVQLFAIVCFLKVSWLKVTSVLFDLLHIGIYVFGGLFFWPWIWNNLTIWWAARSSKNTGLTLNTKVACFSAILVGAPALHINEAAWLAWFDVAETRQVYFEAVKADGTAVKAPGTFFGSHSYSIQHGYMAMHGVAGQYEFTRNASTDSVQRNELSGTCPSPVSLASETHIETAAEHDLRATRLGLFLRNHHEKMLFREAAVGRGSWYLHAHHHPSNPFLYKDFNSLSLNDVVGYNLVMESVCHSLKDGRVQKKVLKRDTEFYDVR